MLSCVISSIEAKPSIDEMLTKLSELGAVSSEAANQQIKDIEARWSEFESNDQKVEFYLQKGYFHLLKGDNELAESTFLEIDKFDDFSVENRVFYYNYLAQVKQNLAQYEQAFDYLYKASDLIPLLKDAEEQVVFYHSSANIFIDIKSWEEALFYSEKALSIASANNLQSLKCYAEAQLLSIKTSNFSSEANISSIDKAIENCATLNIALIQSNLYKNKAKNLAKLDKPNLAIINYKKSLLALSENPYLPEKLDNYIGLSNAYFTDDSVDLAMPLVEFVIQNTEGKELSKERRDAFKLLGRIHESEGSLDKAYLYLNKSYNINSAIENNLGSKNLAYQKIKYAHLDQKAQVEILDQENLLLKLNAKVEKQYKNIYQLFSIIAILFIALITLLMFKFNKQKNRYKELSRKDGLTGIFSRRYALSRAQEIHVSSLADNIKYSVVVFDLDYFKSINDKYGHAIGDWVLKQVTERVSAQIRSEDVFGRLGGEEFILILPNTSESNALKQAKRCLESLKLIIHESFSEGYKVTASFGISTYSGLKNLEYLIQSADDAMYKAKKMGRNQISTFTEI